MKKTINGFTIVELLIVIVVIAILATISIVAYNGIQERARITTTQSDLRNIAQKLTLYHVLNGKYPTTDSELQATGIRDAVTQQHDGVALYCGNADGYVVLMRSQNVNGTGVPKFKIGSEVALTESLVGNWSAGVQCDAVGYPNPPATNLIRWYVAW